MQDFTFPWQVGGGAVRSRHGNVKSWIIKSYGSKSHWNHFLPTRGSSRSPQKCCCEPPSRILNFQYFEFFYFQHYFHIFFHFSTEIRSKCEISPSGRYSSRGWVWSHYGLSMESIGAIFRLTPRGLTETMEITFLPALCTRAPVLARTAAGQCVFYSNEIPKIFPSAPAADQKTIYLGIVWEKSAAGAKIFTTKAVTLWFSIEFSLFSPKILGIFSGEIPNIFGENTLFWWKFN